MPTINEKLRFNFGGKWSDTFGVMSVNTDGGMFEESLVATRDISETKIRGNPKPLLHSVDDDPLEFDLVLAFKNSFSREIIDNVIEWLFVDRYTDLYFEGKEDRIYRCLPIGEATIVHNGVRQGFITINMRCDSPHLYSPETVTDKVSVTTNSTVTILNDGHFDIYPEISLYKKGVGKIVIESLDDGKEIFEVRDLTDLEDIYIDCDREIIETDAIGVYRYDNLIGQFPRILKGKNNRFKITGNCDVQFRYRKRYKM